jgi:DNA topoisomerase-1
MGSMRRTVEKFRKAKGPGARPGAVSDLRYVGSAAIDGGEPGLRRERRGRGFSYRTPDGQLVRDRETLARIRSLAIPPAWTAVWICPDGRGHIQATGRDARGRKQYRYHSSWSARRDETKFEQLLEFGEVLPLLRRRRGVALGENALSRERVLAAVVSLLDSTFARVGNREYRRTNGSFGLTTLENRHAKVAGSNLRLVFRGKSKVMHTVEIEDPRVARVVQRCQGLPGQALFQYVDEAGAIQAIHSEDVNGWLRERSGRPITAKQFRTWHASALALDALLDCAPPSSATEARQAYLGVVERVARRLGNTPSVCRKAYIHPDLERAFAEGALHAAFPPGKGSRIRGLTAREARLLAWLKNRLARSLPLARAS